HGLAQYALAVQPGAVVGYFYDDLPAAVLGRQDDVAFGVLACRPPRLGRFDAVIHAVAHQMGERIDDALDQAFVQLGGCAPRGQAYLLAQARGALTHHAGEAAEYVLHGYHAYRHDGLLEVARIAFQLLYAVEQAIVQDRIE